MTNDNQICGSIEDEKSNKCPSASHVSKASIPLSHLMEALMLILGTSKMVHENTSKDMLPETHEPIAGPTFAPMCVEFKGIVPQANSPVCPKKATRAKKTNEISKARCAPYILFRARSANIRAVV